MRLLDGIALALCAGAGVAFVVGSIALERSQDFTAVYWLIVGVVAVRAAVQISRPGSARG